jgi:hypothetical protein
MSDKTLTNLADLLAENAAQRAEIERLREQERLGMISWAISEAERNDMETDRDRYAREANEWQLRAEAAEAKLAEAKKDLSDIIENDGGKEAALAEERAEREIAYAEYRKAEAALAAERAKTANLVDACQHLGMCATGLECDLCDWVRTAAKASE